MKTKISTGQGMAPIKPWGLITTDKFYNYETGTVRTFFGIVEVYSQGKLNHSNHTRIDFIFNGRSFRRTFNKRYSKKYLVTLANRFAKECASGQLLDKKTAD